MRITDLQKYGLDMAISKAADELEVNIYTMNTGFSERRQALRYGVNWSAKGTQTAEETKKYAHSLILAAEISEKLNLLELEVDYTPIEPELSKEEFLKKAQELTEAVKDRSAHRIAEKLEEIR